MPVTSDVGSHSQAGLDAGTSEWNAGVTGPEDTLLLNGRDSRRRYYEPQRRASSALEGGGMCARGTLPAARFLPGRRQAMAQKEQDMHGLQK